MGVEALPQVADTDGARRDTLVQSNKPRVRLDAAESLSPGTRVRVYWAGDGAWYAGKIISVEKRGHRILYDDGERKLHDLADPGETWELEDTSLAGTIVATSSEDSE